MTKEILTPLALQSTSSATLRAPWFVHDTEYAPAVGTFKPLVNGEDAFGAVYDAIEAATTSIDYICWGFQPSMMFKRSGDRSLSIGDLLIRKSEAGVKVRLLVWMDSILISELSENNMPGATAITALKQEFKSAGLFEKSSAISLEYEIDPQLRVDRKWYWRALFANARRRAHLPVQDFKNVYLATRDFSVATRAEIVWRTALFGKDSARSFGVKAANAAAFAIEPTHHQKVVLVDYEKPEVAIGFVMGHNTLDQYWDRNDHSYLAGTPGTGRNGRHPWQDISSRVCGPLLRYLNANFVQAWKDATGEDLSGIRKGLASSLTMRPDIGDTAIMGQIVRTQSQHDEKNNEHSGTQDIEQMYLQAINNVTQFIFIQNQYFRYVPLAEKIKSIAKTHVEHGRDPDKDGHIHLFVITNASDEAVGQGTVNTYRMLDALGQSQAMPAIAMEDRNEALSHRSHALEADAYRQADLIAHPTRNDAQTNAAATQHARDAIRRDEVEKKEIHDAMKAQIVMRDIPGLRVHICTLVAPDTPDGMPWVDVYVHAKLMVVDDAFTTLGSANINTRSMEVDSELNILHENYALSSGLRRQLWNLHTGGRGADDDPAKAFKHWTYVLNQNNCLKAKKLAPVASLVNFMRLSDTRTYTD